MTLISFLELLKKSLFLKDLKDNNKHIFDLQDLKKVFDTVSNINMLEILKNNSK